VGILCLHSDIYRLTLFSVYVGGDGVNGQDGRDAIWSDVREGEFLMCEKYNDDRACKRHPQYTHTQIGEVYTPEQGLCSHTDVCNPVWSVWRKVDFHYFGQTGESGGRGGNGGRGGCGGVSGYSGQSVIIAYQNRMNEKKASSSSAKLARPGQRGKAGRGGKKGKTAIIKKGRYFKKNSVWHQQEDNEYFKTPAVKTFAESGIEPTECSPLSNKPSVPSWPIALYQLETDYLNFIDEQNSVLIHSSLMDRSFLTHIMNRRSGTSVANFSDI